MFVGSNPTLSATPSARRSRALLSGDLASRLSLRAQGLVAAFFLARAPQSSAANPPADVPLEIKSAAVPKHKGHKEKILLYGELNLGDQPAAPPGSRSKKCQTVQKSSPGLQVTSETRRILSPLRLKREMPGRHPPFSER